MASLRLLPDLEESLRQIPGVHAASVVTGPDAVPTEVHVLAAPGKAAKQVVRDVQSLAMARYDIDIDHRIVSVVQIGDDEVGTPVDVTAPRPAIAAISVRRAGNDVETSVTLTAAGQFFEGRSHGAAGQSHRGRLVAAATLDAVSPLLGHPCEVESVGIVTVNERVLAVVVLSVLVPRSGEQLVTGSALVRGDEEDAVARSVLAALNRRLTG